MRAAAFVLAACSTVAASAQWWDLGKDASHLTETTHGQITVNGESRGRYESRRGSLTGRDPDIDMGLIRSRLSVGWKPSKWIRFSGMVQDSRAPWYGSAAPNSLRDTVDLQEAYFEIRPDSKTGFGMTGGRMMFNYGDGRLIAAPQWGNVARTFDHTRLYYRTGRHRFEALVVSPVKVRPDDFNQPVMGDRIWGMYNTTSNLWRKSALDWYVLRHNQNRPGGFTGGKRTAGTDHLAINSFGGRLVLPGPQAMKYTVEAVVQNGNTGGLSHRAGAFAATASRRISLDRRALDLVAEYKWASGGASETGESRTFDQLSPANHDKFGHEDLFGWRNIHNMRLLASYSVTKALAFHAMYDNSWLADARDALYSGPGKAIMRAASGNNGRHIGQEADLFCTLRVNRLQFGGGYGHFLAGEFVKRTGAPKSPVYLYLFHTYTF